MPGPYRLSYAGQHRLLQSENNIPYVYDDARKKGDPPLARYEDARGFPTIGMGIRIDTEEEREAFRPYLNGRHAPPEFITSWNAKVIGEFERQLNNKLVNVTLNPNQFDALFSLAWNVGVNKDVVQRVIDYSRIGDYEAAAHQILMGPRTSKGEVLEALVKRRQEEATLFLTPFDTPQTKSEPPQTILSRITSWAFYKDPFVWGYFAMGSVLAGLLIKAARTHYKFKRENREWQELQEQHEQERAKEKEELRAMDERVKRSRRLRPTAANPKTNLHRRPKKSKG